MESCFPAMKLNQCTFGLNNEIVSERVSAFWGTQVVKPNHLRTTKLRSAPQKKIQTNLIRSVLTPFVDQESHVRIFYTCNSQTKKEKILCFLGNELKSLVY